MHMFNINNSNNKLRISLRQHFQQKVITFKAIFILNNNVTLWNVTPYKCHEKCLHTFIIFIFEGSTIWNNASYTSMSHSAKSMILSVLLSSEAFQQWSKINKEWNPENYTKYWLLASQNNEAEMHGSSKRFVLTSKQNTEF